MIGSRVRTGALALVLILAGSCVLAQTQKGDGPASAELREIVKADQAGRNFTALPSADVVQKMIAEDRQRRERVAALLQDGKLQTGDDFDNAALVFQHGDTPGDFLTAHELAILAVVHGKRTSLAPLAEDRFLQNIGRTQRFGTQFTLDKDGKMALAPVAEGHPTDVTDTLRADMFVPTPAQWREHPGPEAYTAAQAEIEKRWKQGTEAKSIAENSRRPEAAELRTLARSAADDARAIGRVLELYRSDAFRTPEDYRNAAQVLIRSTDADGLLLAHELAVVAALRGDRAALSLSAKALDLFLVRLGGRPRYGAVAAPEKTAAAPLAAIPIAAAFVRKSFGVSTDRK